MRRRKNKRWSWSTGKRGRNAVRVYEDRAGAPLFLEFYEFEASKQARVRRRVALGHVDRDRAVAQALDAAKALAETARLPKRTLTVGQVLTAYLRDVTPTKGDSKRGHDVRAAKMFANFLGHDRPVHTLSRADWDRFIKQRGEGTIDVTGLRPDSPGDNQRGVGPRQITYDLKFLRAAVQWATETGDGHGGFLLAENPLRGTKYPEDPSPARPNIPHGEYEAMLGVADLVSPRFKLMLLATDETGHRISSVRRLRWSDIDLEQGQIVWPAAHDKMKFSHTTPLSDALADEFRRERRSRSFIGDGWVFSSPGNPEKPVSRELARAWWLRAEKLAGVPHVERRMFHSLRRKFATEMKHTPINDLCYLGGWRSPQTLLKCYQQPDERTMTTALKNRRRVG